MSISRRTFLGTAVVGGAGLASTSLLGAGCGNLVSAAPIVEVAIDDTPSSVTYGQLPVVVPKYQDLVPIGGAVTVVAKPLPPREGRSFTVPPGGVLLVHRADFDDPPAFVALDATCTHAGCPLGYSKEDRLVECPCHSGRFRVVADPADPSLVAGSVVKLPPRQGLTAWEVRFGDDGITLYVDLTAPQGGTQLPAVSGGRITFPIGALAALAAVGGSTIAKAKGLADTLLLVRLDGATILALSAVCTHAACLVEWTAKSQSVLCACHNSTFTSAGAVTRGPATLPLKKYAVAFDGKNVTITV